MNTQAKYLAQKGDTSQDIAAMKAECERLRSIIRAMLHDMDEAKKRNIKFENYISINSARDAAHDQ